MRVFLTGANGWIGSAIVRDLLAERHSVIGLVRSKEKGEELAALGVTPVLGALTDLDVIRNAAKDVDGIIHTAFGLDMTKIQELAKEDREAIETYGEVFAGSDRPIVITGGVGLAPDGEVFTEDARPPVIREFPRASEQTAFAIANRGAHVCVIRNPRSVHGQGENHGFVPMLATVARQKGISAWVGDGQNLWPSVHRLDSARLYRLALEGGEPGAAYHAIAEQGVPYRAIAEAIGRQLGLPARSVSPDEAEAHFGPLAVWVAGNGPASSDQTRSMLGWAPKEIGLIADIERPDYQA